MVPMEPHPFRLLDGGLSTALEQLGADLSGSLWTGRALITAPELITRAHQDFVDAGAEVLITASYQVSREGFNEAGLTALDADRALRASIECARVATASRAVAVAASVGPYGAIRHDGSEYVGNYGLEEDFLADFHRARIAVLAAGKPDYFAVETIPELTETRALVRVLREYPDIPVWFSFVAGSSSTLVSGELLLDALEVVTGLPQLAAIGVNCVPPELVAPVARLFGQHTSLPIVAYPNRGGKWDSAVGQWIGQEPKSLAMWWPEWRAAGVTWVGGCCGNAASDISSLRDAMA